MPRDHACRFAATLAVVSTALLVASSPAAAQFQDPVALSTAPDGEPVSSWAMGIDYFNSAVLAVVKDGVLTIHTLNGERKRMLVIPSEAGEVESPSLAFTALRTYVAYTDRDVDGASRDVWVASKVGTILSPPENLSISSHEERNPSLTIDRHGTPVAAWTRQRPDRPSDVVVQAVGGELTTLGPGDLARIGDDIHGRIHVLFRAPNHDVIYRAFRDVDGVLDFEPPVLIVNQATTPVPYHEIKVCNGDEALVSYTEGDTLFVVRRISDGVFEAPRAVVSGEFRGPFFSCNSRGVLAIAWESEGDIWYRLGSFDFLIPKERAFQTPAIEQSPKIAIDSFLNLYLSYESDGKLLFTTNAAIPEAQFLAEPTEGEAPLRVQFTDRSTGNILRWHWDFGDGSASGSRNPSHVYEQPGEYVVKLAVEGPGGVSTAVGERQIRVLDPSNSMRFSDRRAYPGLRDLYVPLVIDHDVPIQGCQIAMSFDPAALELSRIEIDDNTNIAQIAPELIIHDFSETAEGRTAIATALIIDFERPFDGRTFPPGSGQRLANFVFHVRSSNAFDSETVVELRNQIGEPPINNIFISRGQTILPQLRSGVIRIEEPALPPPLFFLRGDVDASLSVNITDAIVLLNYLFLGAEPFPCFDPADANDDGGVNITDAVVILNYLFLGGVLLPPPFPDLGLDPTPDPLPDCQRG